MYTPSINYSNQVFQMDPIQQSKTLWIGDIDSWMDESYVESLFFAVGNIQQVKIIRDRFSGVGAGYGFVEFIDNYSAQNALEMLNGKPLPNGFGKTYRLNWATYGINERKPDIVQPEYSIFVGDLAPEVNDYQLQQIFQERYPSVKSAKVVTDPNTGLSRRYGFVRFSNEMEMERAMVEMQGQFCGTRPMRINHATPKRPNIGMMNTSIPSTVVSHNGGSNMGTTGGPHNTSVVTNSSLGAGAGAGMNGHFKMNNLPVNMYSQNTLSLQEQTNVSSPMYMPTNNGAINMGGMNKYNNKKQHENMVITPGMSMPSDYNNIHKNNNNKSNSNNNNNNNNSNSNNNNNNNSNNNNNNNNNNGGNPTNGLHPDDPNNTTVFIGGLDPQVSKELLQEYFQPFGEIVYVNIPPGKGCGFVSFLHRFSAEQAIAQMNQVQIGRQRVRLSWGRSAKGNRTQAHYAARYGPTTPGTTTFLHIVTSPQQKPTQMNNSYNQNQMSFNNQQNTQPQQPPLYYKDIYDKQQQQQQQQQQLLQQQQQHKQRMGKNPNNFSNNFAAPSNLIYSSNPYLSAQQQNYHSSQQQQLQQNQYQQYQQQFHKLQQQRNVVLENSNMVSHQQPQSPPQQQQQLPQQQQKHSSSENIEIISQQQENRIHSFSPPHSPPQSPSPNAQIIQENNIVNSPPSTNELEQQQQQQQQQQQNNDNNTHKRQLSNSSFHPFSSNSFFLPPTQENHENEKENSVIFEKWAESILDSVYRPSSFDHQTINQPNSSSVTLY